MLTRFSIPGGPSRGCGWLAMLALTFINAAGSAAEKAAVVVGADDATRVIIRENADAQWHLTNDKDPLFPGTQLLGGLGTTVESANGAVQAKLIADLAGHSPFPVLETSLILQEAKDVDFAFEMDRGRVDLINTKKAGAAKIGLTIRGKSGVITLAEPGTRLVIEMYSRWPKGTDFTTKPTEKDVPALAILFIAVKGEVVLKGPENTFTLKAPPGPAMLLIDGLADDDPHVQTLEKVPEWVDEKQVDRLKKMRSGLLQLRNKVDKIPLGQAVLLLTYSDDEPVRHAALILLGALDDLPRLGIAMATAKHEDIPDEGIIVLRHWIGRAPGQDLKLYNALIEKGGFKPAEAAVALELLHSFDDDEIKRPQTYQGLIHYLDSDRPLVRALANWHLVRLAPAGRSIAFKATAPAEDRAKMVKAWKALIPEGTLPGAKK